MASQIFERLAGYLTVHFSHRNSIGWVNIRFHVHGGTLVTSSCDDEFAIVDHSIAVEPDATLHAWTSSGASHFFKSMVCWLEAVLCQVHECAFTWEGESPDGELRWFNGYEEGGQLVLKWSGCRSTEPFEHQVALGKHQMVKALYEGFRGFVESDRYDPMSYEDLRHGQVWDLVVEEGSPAFVEQVSQQDRESAFALLATVGHFATDTDRGPKRKASVEDLSELSQQNMAKLADLSEFAMDYMEQLTPLSWNQWTVDQRMQHLQDVVGQRKGYGMFGENLRELRSKRIEDWLANPG